jgi:prephenate dehydrogenase
MCGREKKGFEFARSDLYRGNGFILCPNERTNDEIISLALELIRIIGAKPVFMTSFDHDTLVASPSHLAYLISALIMNHVSIAAEKDSRIWQVTASGFRDSSRLAGSDWAMMLDILMTNRENILSELEKYRKSLKQLIDLIAEGDYKKLGNWLEQVQRKYYSYREIDSK